MQRHHLAPDDRRLRITDGYTRHSDRLAGMSLVQWPRSYGKIRRICTSFEAQKQNKNAMLTSVAPDLIFFQIRPGPDLAGYENLAGFRPGPGPGPDMISGATLVPNCCYSKDSAPYCRSNPPFYIFDIRALWRSVLSARAPNVKKWWLDQYGKV